MKYKVLLMAVAIAVYLIVAGSLSIWLHDRISVIFIAMLNYVVAMAVFGPVLPFVLEPRKDKGK